MGTGFLYKLFQCVARIAYNWKMKFPVNGTGQKSERERLIERFAA